MTSLSHDIRPLLTILLGYLDAVRRKVIVGPEREQYLKIAHRKAHDLSGWTRVN